LEIDYNEVSKIFETMYSMIRWSLPYFGRLLFLYITIIRLIFIS
jgi:hypothetical protein